LATVFDQRRAICLCGGPGSGKTAVCTEFCRHFSAPGGRRFSNRVLLVDYARAVCEFAGQSDSSLCGAILAEMQQCGLMTSAPATGSARELSSPPRGVLLRVARQLDDGGPWLLVVDGLADDVISRDASQHCTSVLSADDSGVGPNWKVSAQGCSIEALEDKHSSMSQRLETPSEAMHALLTDLLQVSAHLCILLTARSPPRGAWASLGPSKVVEVQLPSLSPDDMARLLARRAGRPFFCRDFDFADRSTSGPLRLDEKLIGLIAKSPLGKLLANGNPGRIIRAAAGVHAELPSLLMHPWLGKHPGIEDA